jgi:uncharacterized damage-inducible protein DinB
MTSFTELIDSYVAGADQIRKAVAGMTREQLRARPVAGRWSTLQVVAHIADFEPILAERMKRIISHERPLLMVADENLFVNELAYEDRDVNEELAVIDSTRQQMARILRKLPPEKAAKAGVHSQKGLVSLEAVLTSAVNHIPHHLKFIEEKRRALGG